MSRSYSNDLRESLCRRMLSGEGCGDACFAIVIFSIAKWLQSQLSLFIQCTLLVSSLRSSDPENKCGPFVANPVNWKRSQNGRK